MLEPKLQNETTLTWVDRGGIILSLLCVVHCVTTPFLFLLFPGIGAHSHHSHSHEMPHHDEFAEQLIHFCLGMGILFVASIAFYQGYKIHRRLELLYLAGAGLLFLGFGFFLHDYEVTLPFSLIHICSGSVLTIIGSILLIVSHLKNYASCNRTCCSE